MGAGLGVDSMLGEGGLKESRRLAWERPASRSRSEHGEREGSDPDRIIEQPLIS